MPAGARRPAGEELLTPMTDLPAEKPTTAVITGAAGMLGSALLELAPAGLFVVGVDLPQGDLSDRDQARAALAPAAPGVVLHCAAFTDVDGCTRDPAAAGRGNAQATANVAEVCRELGARLLLVSTDYVFDGTKSTPYTEQDLPNPLNVYGESKLAAERLAAERVRDLVIVRTQWLYGPGGRNFVASIVQQAREGRPLRVVADQWGSPTYTRDLAPALWQAALSPARGVVHVTNTGRCTWADLAEQALAAAGLGEVGVERISSQDWPTPTVRPRCAVLDNARWLRLGFGPLRPWPEAVEEYVRKYLR
jgi:dTDP-4-dehydrorhamnose reductase